MSRMQKIVERGKAELAKIGMQENADFTDEGKSLPGRAETLQFEYSKTKKLGVSVDELVGERLVAADPSDPRAARFQILRAKVLQQMRKKGWSSLAISAPTSGAGKSLIAANLATSIAMEGNQSVLLVDMDLRKPHLHQYFCIEPQNGIQDVLEGTATIEETLINPGIERLVILPGRRSMLNPSEQISSPYVKTLVEELKGRYESRIVIFDLPPVLLADDVIVFLPYVDCSLLVVEAGRNNRKEIEESFKAIGTHPILGAVLNKASTKDSLA
jgi:protein-tyrosine kinase